MNIISFNHCNKFFIFELSREPKECRICNSKLNALYENNNIQICSPCLHKSNRVQLPSLPIIDHLCIKRDHGNVSNLEPNQEELFCNMFKDFVNMDINLKRAKNKIADCLKNYRESRIMSRYWKCVVNDPRDKNVVNQEAGYDVDHEYAKLIKHETISRIEYINALDELEKLIDYFGPDVNFLDEYLNSI